MQVHIISSSHSNVSSSAYEKCFPSASADHTPQLIDEAQQSLDVFHQSGLNMNLVGISFLPDPFDRLWGTELSRFQLDRGYGAYHGPCNKVENDVPP